MKKKKAIIGLLMFSSFVEIQRVRSSHGKCYLTDAICDESLLYCYNPKVQQTECGFTNSEQCPQPGTTYTPSWQDQISFFTNGRTELSTCGGTLPCMTSCTAGGVQTQTPYHAYTCNPNACFWRTAGYAQMDCSPVNRAGYSLVSPIWAPPPFFQKFVTKAPITIINTYTEAMTLEDKYKGLDPNGMFDVRNVCPHVGCRFRYISGTDLSSCFDSLPTGGFIQTITKNVQTIFYQADGFEVDPTKCTTTGTATYQYECTTMNTKDTCAKNSCGYNRVNANPSYWFPAGVPLTFQISDNCESPNGITTPSPTSYSYTQYILNGAQAPSQPFSNFFTFAVVTQCVLSGCVVVTAGSMAGAASCTTTTATGWFTGTYNSGTNTVDFTVNTNTIRNPGNWFCLKCNDNNKFTPTVRYSAPFSAEVLAIDCANYITFKTIPTPTVNVVPTTGPHSNIDLQTALITSTDTYACPLQSVTVKNSNGTAVNNFVKTSWTAADGSDLKVYFDSSMLDYFKGYIQITSRTSTINSNTFEVTNDCKPVVISTIPTPNSYKVPTALNATISTVFADMSTFLNTPLSDSSLCPRTYSLTKSGGGAIPASYLTYDSTAQSLKADTNNQINSVDMIWSIQQTQRSGSVTVSSNTFNVNSKCYDIGQQSNVQSKSYNVPTSVPQTNQVVLSNTDMSSLILNSPLSVSSVCQRKYYLLNPDGTAYTGTFVSIDLNTGQVTCDYNKIGDVNLKIQVTQPDINSATTSITLNQFNVQSTCYSLVKKIDVPSFNYIVPSSVPQTKEIPITSTGMESTYLQSPLSDNSVCTRTYALLKSDGTPYVGTFLTFNTANGQLQCDQNQINTQDVKIRVTQPAPNSGSTQLETNVFNLNSVCMPLSWKAIPSSSYLVPPLSPQPDITVIADVYSYLNTPNSDNSVCTRTYTLLNSDASPFTQTGNFLTFTSPTLKVDTDQVNIKQMIVRVTQSGTNVDSGLFSISCSCDNTGYTVTPDPWLAANQYQTFPLNGSWPQYVGILFTADQPSCPIASYEFCDGNPGPCGATGIGQDVQTWVNSPVSLLVDDKYKSATYPFYIKITLTTGQVIWGSVGGNQKFTLDVACIATSTTLSEGAFPFANLNATQYTDVGKGECFILPDYYSSFYQACPIVERLTTEFNFNPPVNNNSLYVMNPIGSNNNIVCPHDDNLNARYEFYIRLKAKGGAELYTQKYVLYHGCPPGQWAITLKPSYTEYVDTHVSVSKYRIWGMIGKYELWPPACKANAFFLTNLKVNNYPSTSGVVYSTYCGSAATCGDLDLTWNDFPHNITFIYRLTLSNGVNYDTNLITIILTCKPWSVTIVPSFLTINYNKFEQYTLNNKVSFNNFTCKPLACCSDLVYTLSISNTSSISDNQPHGALRTIFNGFELNPIYTGAIKKYVYYVRCDAPVAQAIFYSVPFIIDVVYNCRFDTIIINPNSPVEAENKPTEVTFINEDVSKDYRPNLHLNRTTNWDKEYKYNITGRFLNNASQYCPLKTCFIYKIQEMTKFLEIQPKDFLLQEYANVTHDIWLDTYTCYFKLFKENNPYSVYAHVNISNGYVWLQQKDPLIFVNLIEPWRDPPNFAPIFKGFAPGAVVKFRINATVVHDINPYQIKFPMIEDSAMNDTWFVTIDGLQSYLYLNERTRVIDIFNLNRIPRYDINKTFTYDMKLIDKGGLFTPYKLQIEFFEDYWYPGKSAIAIMKPDDSWHYGPGKNVCMHIEKIDIYGLMEIRFNATMFNEFNFSTLTNKSLDIYMLPNPDLMPMHGIENITNWNLTWNLTYYNNTGRNGTSVMKIQLNFANVSAISQLIDQDRIVVHVKNNHTAAFKSVYPGNYLHHTCRTQVFRVRKQLDLHWKWAMDIFEKIVKAMWALLILCFGLMNLKIGANFRYFMWYLRSLQLVVHFPMIYIVVPPNVARYLEVVKPIVVFDVFPSDDIANWIWTFDLETQRKFASDILDQMEDIGYGTHNSILILGSLWIYLSYYAVKLSIYLTYKVYLKYYSLAVHQNEGGDGKRNDFTDFQRRRKNQDGQSSAGGDTIRTTFDWNRARQQALEDAKVLETSEMKIIDYETPIQNQDDGNFKLETVEKLTVEEDDLNKPKDVITWLKDHEQGQVANSVVKTDNPMAEKIRNWMIQFRNNKRQSFSSQVISGNNKYDSNIHAIKVETKYTATCNFNFEKFWNSIKDWFRSFSLKKFILGFRDSLFWILLLMLLIEPYMEYAIAGIMNMHNWTVTYSADGFANFVGFWCMVFSFIILPAVFFGAYNVKLQKFRSIKYTEKFSSIFWDVRNRSRWHAQYVMIMLLRRLVFLCIVFGYPYLPGPQIITILFKNLIYVIYIGTKPMQTKVWNLLHFLEEMVIEACTLHMLVFLWSEIETVDLGYGWSMIIIMNLHLLIVILYVLYLIAHMIGLVLQKLIIIWKVYCVENFGFRIGRQIHASHYSKSEIPQMMMLAENFGNLKLDSTELDEIASKMKMKILDNTENKEAEEANKVEPDRNVTETPFFGGFDGVDEEVRKKVIMQQMQNNPIDFQKPSIEEFGAAPQTITQFKRKHKLFTQGLKQQYFNHL